MTRVNIETWDGMSARLLRAQVEIEGMLAHLHSRPPAPSRRKRERKLGGWLHSVAEWIELVVELGPPPHEDEAVELIMELYQFDTELPRVVDEFQRLLEEAGEIPAG